MGMLRQLSIDPVGHGDTQSMHRLPSATDRAFVASLMGRCVEPGKFANWIAPPVMGINRQPVDFEYVRF
ncbi:MAG: benzoyl-CoA 2,3-epoxidase subunit BoxB, partial [Betaproteobacteria bacterium]